MTGIPKMSERAHEITSFGKGSLSAMMVVFTKSETRRTSSLYSTLYDRKISGGTLSPQWQIRTLLTFLTMVRKDVVINKPKGRNGNPCHSRQNKNITSKSASRRIVILFLIILFKGGSSTSYRTHFIKD